MYLSELLYVFVRVAPFICQGCSIHIFFTIEEDISFLGWTRWKLLGIPWKSGRKRFVGSAPRLLIFHAAAYFEPRKNKTPLLAQKRHHHHFHRHRRLNLSCQNEYSKVMFLDTSVLSSESTRQSVTEAFWFLSVCGLHSGLVHLFRGVGRPSHHYKVMKIVKFTFLRECQWGRDDQQGQQYVFYALRVKFKSGSFIVILLCMTV